MNLAALDLNLLVALEALLMEESVGGAARRVGLSQPAMSHALSRLRKVLGDPLLVRAGARMQPTLRAEAIREPLREALAQVRGVLRAQVFEPASSTRTFHLLMSDYAAGVVLPPLLSRLRREAPNVRIEVNPWTGRQSGAFDATRRTDAALTCEVDVPSGFHRRRLFSDRDACAIRRGNPAARRLRTVSGFLAASHVAVAEREFVEDPVDTWLRDEKNERRVQLVAPHYFQALNLVAQTDLVAVIPERLIRAYARTLGLMIVPVPLDVGTFDEYLLHPSRTHADPGCAWLRGVLKEIGDSFAPRDDGNARSRRDAM